MGSNIFKLLKLLWTWYKRRFFFVSCWAHTYVKALFWLRSKDSFMVEKFGYSFLFLLRIVYVSWQEQKSYRKQNAAVETFGLTAKTFYSKALVPCVGHSTRKLEVEKACFFYCMIKRYKYDYSLVIISSRWLSVLFKLKSKYFKTKLYTNLEKIILNKLLNGIKK